MSQQEKMAEDLLRLYEDRKRDAEILAKKKSASLYEKYPDLAAIRSELITNAVTRARNNITNQESDAIIKKHDELLAKRAELLSLYHLTEEDFLPQYHCPLCSDTGFIDSDKCSCRKKEEARWLYRHSHIEADLKAENFDTLRTDIYDETVDSNGLSEKSRMESIIKKCRDYAASFPQQGSSLYLYGSTGVGKTFLSNCIAKEILDRGFSVLYFSAPAFFEMLSTIHFDRNEDKEFALADFIQYDLLILDDLGTEFMNSLTQSDLFYILNERILKKKSTIISSNLSLNQVRERYTERIASRLISFYECMEITGQDKRIQHKLEQKRIS